MESHVGCYETGSLDFFGPLCVVACYVDQKDEKELNELGLDKEMSTNDIEKIGKILKDKLTYSLLLLDNSHYNQCLNYLKISNNELAILANFNLISLEYKRIVSSRK